MKSFACLLIDNPAGIGFKATTKSENAHCNDSMLQWQKNGPIHFLLTAAKDFNKPIKLGVRFSDIKQ